LFLGKSISTPFPTREEEQAFLESADVTYASAVKWLKERTRGKDFLMVDRENAQYGFRRNLRGMKYIAVALCSVTVFVSFILILFQADFFRIALEGGDWKTGVRGLEQLGPAIWASLFVNIVAIVGWLSIVNDAWVRQAGYQYASALLACCDQISQKTPMDKPSKRRVSKDPGARS
jgi:hypothetical protein